MSNDIRVVHVDASMTSVFVIFGVLLVLTLCFNKWLERAYPDPNPVCEEDPK